MKKWKWLGIVLVILLTASFAFGQDVMKPRSNNFGSVGDATHYYARGYFTGLSIRGITYTWPAADGTIGQQLTTSGAGVLSWAAASAMGVTAINDIGDAAGNGTINQTGYKQIWTSTLNTAGAVWTMTNTTADLTADVSFLDLKFTDDGDANGYFIRGYDNAGGDLKFSIGADGAAVFGTASLGATTITGATGITGAVTITGDVGVTGNLTQTGTFYQSALAAAAAGNVALTVNAAGNGTITIGGVSTGNTIFPGLVKLNGSVDIGDAASDTLTITSVIDGDVTLYDAVTDSPALILKDATAETAQFIKKDAANLQLTIAATEALQIVTGNLVVGAGSPTVAINGEDAYITGTFEVDGAARFDGAITTTGGISATGAIVNLNVASNFAVNINTGNSSGALSLGGGSGTVAVNSTTWDVDTAGAFTGVTGITFTPAATVVTQATTGSAQNLTLSQTGAQDVHLIVSTTGTSIDALQLTASAGGVKVSANNAAANQFQVTAAGTVAGNAVNVATTDGGIVLTAGGAANGDVTLTAGDAFAMNATGTAAITSSDWGISTTGVVTKIASLGFDSLSVYHIDTVEVTSAQVKALNAAPKELIATPGSGYFIEVISAVLILDYSTNVFTVGAGDDLVIQYNTSGQDITGTIETTGWLDQAADQMKFTLPAGVASVTAANVANKAVELFNVGSEVGGNASGLSVVRVKITYIVHPTGL